MCNKLRLTRETDMLIDDCVSCNTNSILPVSHFTLNDRIDEPNMAPHALMG